MVVLRKILVTQGLYIMQFISKIKYRKRRLLNYRTKNNTASWRVTPRSLAEICLRFGRILCLKLGGWGPLMRSSLFYDVTQRKLVVSYRRFGTTHRSNLQGSTHIRPCVGNEYKRFLRNDGTFLTDNMVQHCRVVSSHRRGNVRSRPQKGRSMSARSCSSGITNSPGDTHTHTHTHTHTPFTNLQPLNLRLWNYFQYTGIRIE
jgi:hypothetical protein